MVKAFAFLESYFMVIPIFYYLDNRVYLEKIKQFHISIEEVLRYGKW